MGFSPVSKSVFWEANPAKQGNPATLFSEHLDRNCLTVRTKIAAGSRGTRPAGCRHLGDKLLNLLSNNTHSSAASGSRLPHWFLMKEGTWRGSPGRSGPQTPEVGQRLQVAWDSACRPPSDLHCSCNLAGLNRIVNVSPAATSSDPVHPPRGHTPSEPRTRVGRQELLQGDALAADEQLLVHLELLGKRLDPP